MKIYAITRGCYSDYEICALTVDKDRAEKIKKILTYQGDEATIETFEDGELGKDVQLLWHVEPNRDWFTYYCGVCEIGRDVIVENAWGPCLEVYAPDEEHAKKKAQDMYAEYKAWKERIV